MKDWNILKYKYSNLFYNKFFGFECDDGWYDLIEELLSKIQFFDVKISQIKSKFGGLRVYVLTNDSFVNRIIEFYEEKAKKTCEYCGNRGFIVNERWIAVLCNSCYYKKYFKNTKKCYKFHNDECYNICA